MDADLTTGERIRALRESRGMSRPVLAQLCGRGPDWLKKIETGERELTSHPLLLRLATALQVADLSVITGTDTVAAAATAAPLGRLTHPGMPAIWSAVMTRSLTPAGSPVTAGSLQGRVDQTWRLWHASAHNRTEVSALLPDLIRDGEHAVRVLDGDQRRQAHVALSDIYRLTGQATAYVAPAELAWVVADRALAAAQAADQPAAIAAASWNLGNILRETSYAEEALRVVEEAAALIRPHLDGAPDDWRGIYGALQLHAAVTAAREGQEGDAWRYWEKGDQVAKSLPASYVHPSTVFGRANVDFHAVSLDVDLRKAGRALGAADDLDPDVMPSVERRARLWVEVARGHLQRGDRTAALHVMQMAHRIGAETVAYTPSAREVAASLWRSAPRALRPEAARLAVDVGIATA
ncbi:helix-turn-helix domain-containing protein [Streptomyces sp. JV180]|uniref:helix-turn-helix domain-containing protein n=1 Tax=Streptomyces sp. JV180 TaxID=858634 RepID=UPI00168BF6E4|nr:helix-turn-helix transcriptional regulator [Streptomyces sp. JV180]MBD3546851.1 helix-turn-helix domain-containing protein [Streptomyces sp. JV180]